MLPDCMPVGWSSSKLKSCGVQQAGASTFYLRRHCQSTALWLTRWRQLVTLAFTSMRTHVLSVQGTVSWFFVVQLRQIRRHIPPATFQTADTGGSFSSVATELRKRRTGRPTCLYLVRRIQLILNASARMNVLRRSDHLIESLTRLPTYTGAKFEIAVLAYFFMGRVTSIRLSVCLI